MRKCFNFWVSILIILSVVVLGGCGLKPLTSSTPQSENTGKIVFKIQIPSLEENKINSNPTSLQHFGQKFGINSLNSVIKNINREIPSETDKIEVCVYNTSTGWYGEASIYLQTGQTDYTATIENIPVGSGYTVEAVAWDYDFPVDYCCLVVGKQENITILSGENRVTLTLSKYNVPQFSFPDSVIWNQQFSGSVQINVPVNLNIFQAGAIFANNIDYSSADSLIIITTPDDFSPLFLPANTPTSITLNKVIYDSSTQEPPTGPCYLTCVFIRFIQPISNYLYTLVWVPSQPFTIGIQQTDTGSIEIIIN